jgi:3-phosphoshikimate 1-carboxyvinyltransferase
MELLSPKLRRRQKTTYSYSLQFDPCQKKTDRKIVVTLPGDDILTSVFLTAKALIPRGQLVLENVCIEPWSNSIIRVLRKMGSIITVQETRIGSFGSIGNVRFKKCKIVGQKIDCKPLFQYIRQLPSMLILVTFAKGRSIFRSLDELRYEMPLSIAQMLKCIDIIGGRYGEMPDGIVIDGIREYDGFDISKNYSAGLNAACAVAGLKCNGKSTIADDAILHRWPQFSSIVNSICDLNSK